MTPLTVYYLLSRRVQNGIAEGLCFISESSYMTVRLLIVRSYFAVRQYLATVGVFVYFESDLILRPID